MTSSRKLSISNRNRILNRIYKELWYTGAKSKHIAGYLSIRVALKHLEVAMKGK